MTISKLPLSLNEILSVIHQPVIPNNPNRIKREKNNFIFLVLPIFIYDMIISDKIKFLSPPL